jgi:hypothetical protein
VTFPLASFTNVILRIYHLREELGGGFGEDLKLVLSGKLRVDLAALACHGEDRLSPAIGYLPRIASRLARST